MFFIYLIVLLLDSSDDVSKSAEKVWGENMSSDEEVAAASRPYFIGKKENIIQARRVLKSVGGRDVLVMYHQGDFYAIDARCYRKLLHATMKSNLKQLLFVSNYIS